jgi:hypothetical protein
MVNSNKTRSDEYHVTISSFDVSENIGIIATGGAAGRILLIDPFAHGVLNSAIAHFMIPIIMIVIYES